MASLFKKTFAAVLAIAMVVTCFTVSAADVAPAINVASAYVESGANTAEVDIYTENFGSIYGSQFTVTLPAGYVATSIVNNAEGDLDWVEDSNCKISENVIKFLDVRTNKGFNFTINVTVPEEASGVKEITVDNTYFIDSNEAEYEGVVINDGVISVAKAVEVPEGETSITVESDEGYFIPYGDVTVKVDGKDEYVNKNENGSFTVTGNTTYTQIKLPSKEVGVTTFGTGEKDEDIFGEAGIQFGSYAINAAGKKFGTLAIKGDFAGFKAYCKANGMTDKAIYDRMVSFYNDHNEGSSVGMSCNGGKIKISVLCIAQRKYMWYSLDDNGDVNHLQYAARITNPEEGVTYSGIAYSYIDDAYTFSKEVKDITK